LDSLNPNVRETLQQASVIGRIFWTDIVKHMHNPEYQNVDAPDPITDRLGTLRTKELIYRYEESASREASEFIFKNAILHDVTYESVLLRLRPVYHVQVAEGLVEIGASAPMNTRVVWGSITSLRVNGLKPPSGMGALADRRKIPMHQTQP
jgi:predicted ATPase